jgi:hypothetical protein
MNKGPLVALKPPRLPYHEAVEERFGENFQYTSTTV